MRLLISGFIILFSSFSATAGEVDVLDVKAEKNASGSYRFSVTVKHADEGWDHYADKWDVVDSDGNILGTRVLAHPHVNEQPFTRSLSNIEIPEDVKYVLIRAHDSVHKYGGKEFKLELPR
ncbi:MULTISPECIES: hypothetical protein [unclassified Lentilitoribacter]|jgi:hypothetical protein|uniref:hypothetical protein n=1 Tax=unclassified Lentilitoribacter TaxID=2647570 RepID=UPI0013A6E31B|nr:hypothetical protein [Lentilitoribacter sp. Alg239-R112]